MDGRDPGGKEPSRMEKWDGAQSCRCRTQRNLAGGGGFGLHRACQKDIEVLLYRYRVITSEFVRFLGSSSENPQMNMDRTHFAAAILMAFVGCAAVGQNGPPTLEEEWPVVHAYCRTPNYPLPGLSLYVDKEDGFQFKYPSALKTEDSSLEFENSTCVDFFHLGEGIRLEVSLPSAYEEPIFTFDKDASVETQIFNQLKWTNYSTPAGAEFCTWKSHEQVCIEGIDTSVAHRVSNNLLRAMREIESTFVFTDITSRLDSRIAAVKVGDRFGNLRAKRVVTMEMEDRNQKKYYLGSYGEIYFTGSLKLVGGMENMGTMNSGPRWEFSPDSKNGGSPLPFDLGTDLLDSIEFNNNYSIDKRLSKLPPSPYGTAVEAELTIVVKNIVVIFHPARGGSIIRADLVSMVENH